MMLEGNRVHKVGPVGVADGSVMDIMYNTGTADRMVPGKPNGTGHRACRIT